MLQLHPHFPVVLIASFKEEFTALAGNQASSSVSEQLYVIGRTHCHLGRYQRRQRRGDACPASERRQSVTRRWRWLSLVGGRFCSPPPLFRIRTALKKAWPNQKSSQTTLKLMSDRILPSSQIEKPASFVPHLLDRVWNVTTENIFSFIQSTEWLDAVSRLAEAAVVK